jgi:hypothetical protein
VQKHNENVFTNTLGITFIFQATHLGKIPFWGRCLPTTARSRRGGRKTLGRRESANEAN